MMAWKVVSQRVHTQNQRKEVRWVKNFSSGKKRGRCNRKASLPKHIFIDHIGLMNEL